MRPTTYLSSGSTSCVTPTGAVRPEVNQDTWPLNALWFQIGAASEQLPTVANNNGIVVPAADGPLVGSVALYLSVTSRSVPSIVTWDSATTRYQYLYGRYDAGTPTTTSCTCDRENPAWCPAANGCYPSLQPWYLYLGQADSKVYGSLTFNTSNLLPGAASTIVLGPPSSNAPMNVFSRSIPH